MATIAPDGGRIYYAGESGSPKSSVTGGPVRIEDIRQKYKKNNLFQDPDFLPIQSSIGNPGGDSAAKIKLTAKKYFWARPQEICKGLHIDRPQFAAVQNEYSTKAFSEYDIKQGGLGDCWYVAALQALTKRPDQLKFVIPEDNIDGFEDDKYCGAFHFRFYHTYQCKWVDIVIDDRLPATYNGLFYSTAFTSVVSQKKDNVVAEFWCALMEKAYAKFIGTYAMIDGGFAAQGLEDFTGGFAEIINLFHGKPSMSPGYTGTIHDVYKRKIIKLLKGGNFCAFGSYKEEEAGKYSALEAYTQYSQEMNFDTFESVRVKKGYKLVGNKLVPDSSREGYGLVGPHAYTLLDAQEVKPKDGSEPYFLLKLRNPWGEKEWNGTFRDIDDDNWRRLEKDLRARNKAGSTDIDEGVFWIDLHDAMKYFSAIECCYFGMEDGTKFTYAHGTFPAALQYKGLAKSNTNLPQFQAYKFEVNHALDIEIPKEYGANKCAACFTVIIDEYASEEDIKLGPFFQFYVYKVTEKDLETFRADFYTHHRHALLSGMNAGREVSKWSVLDPGTYIIIPQLDTSPSGENGTVQIPPRYAGKDINYTIRLFTENETKLEPVEIQPPKALSPFEQKHGFGSASADLVNDINAKLNAKLAALGL